MRPHNPFSTCDGVPDSCESCPPSQCCACPDIDGDGLVTSLDLTAMLLCFGLPADPPCDLSDLNCDGAVNVLDLVILLLAFGTSPDCLDPCLR